MNNLRRLFEKFEKLEVKAVTTIICIVIAFILFCNTISASEVKLKAADNSLGNNWYVIKNANGEPKLYVADPNYTYMNVTSALKGKNNMINVSTRNNVSDNNNKFMSYKLNNENWIEDGNTNGQFNMLDNIEMLNKGKNFVPYGFNTFIKSYPKGEGNVLDVNPSYSDFVISRTNRQILFICSATTI